MSRESIGSQGPACRCCKSCEPVQHEASFGSSGQGLRQGMSPASTLSSYSVSDVLVTIASGRLFRCVPTLVPVYCRLSSPNETLYSITCAKARVDSTPVVAYSPYATPL